MRSKALSSRKTRKPRRIYMYFRGLSTLSFPFCTIPQTEKLEFFLWHFDQILRYFIKFQGFHRSPSFQFRVRLVWVQCEMENLEQKMLATSSQTCTLALLEIFRHLPACTCSSTQQDQSLFIHSWGSRSLKQNFSRSPIICGFFVQWEHDNFSPCKVLS